MLLENKTDWHALVGEKLLKFSQCNYSPTKLQAFFSGEKYKGPDLLGRVFLRENRFKEQKWLCLTAQNLGGVSLHT